ncbi:unnamed protein product [Lymnaea stagnalis]|uniref:CUB domain-containing protein n=1 Tax=Lymnaea stagnalis TaxID=6523 RepID=A0AAV2IDC0_LYMST
MMGVYVLATLLSVWLVCTGAHVIDKRQASYSNLALCQDTAFSIGAYSNLYVKSPNYGFGNYQDSTRCNLVLQSGSETLFITVRFDVVELEYNLECVFDSICVGGYKFCGPNWAANKEYSFIIPANRTFTLDFKTDGSVTGRGFQLFITASPFTGQTALTPVGGVGSSNNSLQVDYLTYSSNYSDTYQDKCRIDNYGGNGYYQTSPNYYTDNPWYYQTSPNYYTDNPWYYQTSPNYYTDYYQTSPNYYTNYPWYYQTSQNYYTDNPWYYQTSQNYYTDYPWYYQTSQNYYTDYPWYYQTSQNYYTDYPYYYNTSPDRRTDSTFLLYSLYEALSSLSQANFDIQTAIQHLQRAIAHVDGSVARKK